MNSVQKFSFEQCLHGYQDGHRLLAASCKLSRDTERTMLALSDLSGPSGGVQFDPYLTGYPLKEEGVYAVAMTWPAMEISRPGCVWTNTLLLPIESVSAVNSLRELVTVFKRPIETDSFDSYRGKGSLELSTVRMDSPISPEAFAVVEALVSRPDSKVAFGVEKHSLGLQLLDEVWGFIWPNVRNSFSFCSLIKSPQTLHGVPLDLQFFLVKDRSTIKRRSAGKLLRIADLETPASDLSSLFIVNQRTFSNAFPASLAGMGLLYELAARMSSAENAKLAEVINFLGEHFPKPNEGLEAKTGLLGEDNKFGFSQVHVLLELISSVHSTAFDLELSSICQPLSRIWSSFSDALSIIHAALRHPENTLVQHVLRELAKTIPSRMVAQLAEADMTACGVLMELNPSLCSDIGIWQGGSKVVNSLLEKLSEIKDLIVPFRDALVANAVNTDLSQGWSELIAILGEDSIAAALAAYEKKKLVQFPEAFREVVVSHSDVVADWLRSRSATTGTLTKALLSSLHRVPFTRSQQLFQPLVPSILKNRDDVIASHPEMFLAFGLGLFCKNESVSVNLLPAIHDLVASGRASDADWSIIADILPPNDGWFGWDRCKQIRTGIAERYLYGDWRPSGLFAIDDSKGLLTGVLHEIKKLHNGKRFLKDLNRQGGISLRLDESSSEDDDFID